MSGYFKRMPELYNSSYYTAILSEKAKEIKDNFCALKYFAKNNRLQNSIKDTFIKKQTG